VISAAGPAVVSCAETAAAEPAVVDGGTDLEDDGAGGASETGAAVGEAVAVGVG
jgi:hypothetical protein